MHFTSASDMFIAASQVDTIHYDMELCIKRRVHVSLCEGSTHVQFNVHSLNSAAFSLQPCLRALFAHGCHVNWSHAESVAQCPHVIS